MQWTDASHPAMEIVWCCIHFRPLAISYPLSTDDVNIFHMLPHAFCLMGVACAWSSQISTTRVCLTRSIPGNQDKSLTCNLQNCFTYRYIQVFPLIMPTHGCHSILWRIIQQWFRRWCGAIRKSITEITMINHSISVCWNEIVRGPGIREMTSVLSQNALLQPLSCVYTFVRAALKHVTHSSLPLIQLSIGILLSYRLVNMSVISYYNTPIWNHIIYTINHFTSKSIIHKKD